MKCNNLIKTMTACALFAAFAVQNANASAIYLEPMASTANIDDLVTVNIYGDFTSATEGGGVLLSFDNTNVVTASAVDYGTTWNFNNPVQIDNAAGTVQTSTGFLDFVNPGVIGDRILIATITFIADAVGSTNLSLALVANDPWIGLDAFPLADMADPALNQSASITVVPIPAAVWLLGSGLVGLIGMTRRKRSVTA